MRELPTIKAYRVTPIYIYPFKEYVYKGTQPLSDEKPKTRPSSPICEIEDCDMPIHGVGFCSRHYYRYRAAVRKDPSLRKKRPTGFQADACGTSRGYERHNYWSVPICDPCKAAHSKYRYERKLALKAKKEAAA